MKVTHNWLKDFVDIKITPQALADKLTMAGLEVTALEEHAGDFVYEIEITSNRPDWLSVIGIAREVAAITNSKLKTPNSKPKLIIKNDKSNFTINIENKKDCPLYAAKIIKGVKVGPSPDWLKKRLELLGCRSVNNIVDITNYVLFEYGEPLHAFDLDKISHPQGITVRRARKGEEIITIDGVKRGLDDNILVIASSKPIAIAGIMGGKDTEVIIGTKNILLEAAIFDPIIVRRGRQGLGIQSESAYRFERGIDIEIVEKASARAAELIKELAAGECVLAKTLPKALTKIKKSSISLSAQEANKMLGADISPSTIKRILTDLGFQLKLKAKNNFLVSIPSHRQDINSAVDLIEEIARVYGYENIEKSLPAVKPRVTIAQTRDLVSQIKDILLGLGSNEVITYSLIDKNLLKDFNLEYAEQTIEILNPLSKEQEILRPALIPSLVRCVALNFNQRQEYVNIFELAPVFSGPKDKPEEKLILGFALSGIKPLWGSQGRIKDEMGFLHLKGILEVLFERAGIQKAQYSIIKENSHKFKVLLGGASAGVLVQIEKSSLDRLGIKNKEVFAAEIALDKVLPLLRPDKKFSPLPRFPGVLRDISLVLKEDIAAEQVIKVALERGGGLLQEAMPTDYYKGKQIEPGFKGLTISCLYSSNERTLTEEEINPIHAGIIQGLKEQLRAKIR